MSALRGKTGRPWSRADVGTTRAFLSTPADMSTTFSSEKTGGAPSIAEARRAAGAAASTRARVMRSAEELEKALISIRQARDMVIARNLELSSELGQTRDLVIEMEGERDAADHDRDAALQLAQDLSRQNDELRERALSLVDESATLQSKLREAQEGACGRQTPDGAPAGNDDATMRELRRELAEMAAVNELMKSQYAKHAGALSAQLASTQRARDIAVASVTNAQRQIERLAGERRSLQTQIESDRATFSARIAQLESHVQTAAPAPVELEAEPVDPSGSFVTGDCGVTTALIRSCVESLSTDPATRATLDELDERFHGCAANASGLGHGAIARFSAACGELTRWLCKTPRKVEATLPTLREAVEILAALSSHSHPEQIADPAGALVYSVDDDGDNCECITMSLEKMALRTRYAMKPETALAELGTLPCDIITLDVDLGSMDGFELSTHIRAMELHRDTPIIFLSGLMSTKDRIATLSGGPYDFIPKPYNLNELGVIALGTILKARLAKLAGPTILLIV